MTEGNLKNNSNQLGQHQDLNSVLSEYESSVMNFNLRYALCFQNFITVGGSWNKNLHLQPLQRYYCENSGSSSSACVMRRGGGFFMLEEITSNH